MSDKNIGKIFAMEKKINSMESYLNGLAKIYKQKIIDDQQEINSKNSDKSINCDKCSNFLGFFDIEEQKLRFNYKGLVVYWVAGVNGNITIICNSCSYANNLGYIGCED